MIFHYESKLIINDVTVTSLNFNTEIPELISSSENWVKETGLFLHAFLDKEDYIQVNTSGTTGEQKKYLVLKSRLVQSALMTGKYFNLQPGKSALLSLPITYIAGKMMLVRAIVLGLNLHVVKPTSNPFLYTNLPDRFDFSPFVPLQLQTILESDETKSKINRICNILIGGAGLNYHLTGKIKSLKCQVFESFGMTETYSHIAVRKINNKEIENPPFEALSGVSFSLDKRGCLVIIATDLLDEPLITNDIVQLINPFSFFWVGRNDNVINSGGIKIHPEMLEKEMEPLIPCNFCFVPIPDDRLGQKLALVMECSNYNTLQMDKITIKLKEIFSKYQFPKLIYASKELKRNTHGKLLRQKMGIEIATGKSEAHLLFP